MGSNEPSWRDRLWMAVALTGMLFFVPFLGLWTMIESKAFADTSSAIFFLAIVIGAAVIVFIKLLCS